VLAARNGIIGALREDLIDTRKESRRDPRAAHTPGGAFGSCRFKLKRAGQPTAPSTSA
jgi:ATP-dependent phosphofructokinase / diphosphate-dependent phosphofructokinase